MQQKEDKKQIQSQTFRYRILPLFSTNVQIHKIPLCGIEIVFEVIMMIQTLKFPIDYFSVYWFGQSQAVFSYLDLTYYENSISGNGFQSILILIICVVTIYWMTLIALFMTNYEFGETSANFRRFILLLLSTVLFMPILNTILNLFNCSQSTFFRPCLIEKNSILIALSIATFVVFAIMILGQSFLRFQFIEDPKVFKRIKSSSFISVGLILYVILNEITFYYLQDMVKLIILDISIVIMLIVFFLKDQHLYEWTKLLQLNMLVLNFIPIVMINAMYFLNIKFNFAFLLIIWPISIVAIQKFNLHTLEFEIQNVNKWNTPAMMIRYAQTLRKLLKRTDDFYFLSSLHGYMDVHQQKCDNPACPYNMPMVNPEDEFLSLQNPNKKLEEVLRTQGIIKKIFNDGCKIAPINPQLQLQYAHFLFDIDQKQASLKHLLLIKYDELSFDKYFKYVTLKEKIHNEMCEKPQREFLDLVSELEVKRKQEEIIQKLQQAALINLQFWSVLNEDHPDFQKLNEIGGSRVKIGHEVRQRYKDICKYAHSEKITNLYIHFLTSIENNEEMYSKLYEDIKKKFRLDQKIVLQDWSNSSLSTLLVSIESTNYGTMIDLNSTCASMFGYEKYEIVNRHFKTLFSQEMRDQIRQFLNPKIKDRAFFMSHKNGYLLKINRKVQTYNSMQTGLTSICTLNNVISLNSCFIAFNKMQKAVGLSSSCISLLGIDHKMIQQGVFLKDVLNISLEDVKKSAINGNQSYKLSEIMKMQIELTGAQFRKQPYTLNQSSYSDGSFYIEFTIARGKLMQKFPTVPIKKFQFQIQTTLDNFRYIGLCQTDGLPYLSQFSQLHFAQTIKNSFDSDKVYGAQITTLRLRDNIIQVIQQAEQQVSEKNVKKQGQSLFEQVENLTRKDEEEIFASKESFEKFIQSYQVSKWIRLIVLLGIVIAVATSIGYYFIFKSHNDATVGYFNQIAYQNLIIGTIAKQFALITTVELMKAGVSHRDPTSYYNISLNNINYLQSIKLLGSSPYPLTTYISADSPRQFYSDQFLLSYINYAISMISSMNGKTTQAQLVAAYNSVQSFKIDYLKLNGNITRAVMHQNLQNRQGQILQNIKTSINMEIIMFVVACAFLLILAVIVAIIISRINEEKIKTLQIFLGTTQQQIQKFSSKTQKFLISLHVQDTTGEIDLQDDDEYKKKNTSTFAKKKRFKLVKLSKIIYLKILLIPILGVGFFLQSFLLSYTNLQFMYNSIPYVFLTSQADNTFYTAVGAVQIAIKNHGTQQTGLTNSYLQYYRQYFDTHYQTFGQIADFHKKFTSVFMENICDGPVPIAGACNLSILSANGTLLIFTDITVRTQKSNFSQDFTNDYYVGYSVISSSHKYLTMKVLTEQQNMVSAFQTNLLNFLIMWIFILIGVTIIYGLYILNGFIKQVDQNKNMLTLLPISIAKTLPQVKRYINSILKAGNIC